MVFKSLLLFLLLIMAVWVRHCSGACGDQPNANDPCLPVTDANKYCKDCTTANYDKIVDPMDCHYYYYCKAEALLDTNHYKCPDEMHFDIGTKACAAGSACTNRCQNSGGGGGGGCTYSCSAIDGNANIPDQFDCTVYHSCVSGTLGPKTPCPSATPYFDGSKCQDDVTKCCHCHPYCYPGVIGSIPDPIDCTKYHMCLGEGEPDDSGQCQPGENFDSISGVCSPWAPCGTICKNVIGTNGCIDLFTCTEFGFFAKCPFKCSNQYFYCKTLSDDYVNSNVCPRDQLFDPDKQTCVNEDECPYPTVRF